MHFVHVHPSFKQSKARGAPLKTMVMDSIVDEPVCVLAMLISRLKVGKVDGKC